MIQFYKNGNTIYAVQCAKPLGADDQQKLEWLFSGAKLFVPTPNTPHYIGPRREMITPWSTNAVEITQNMGVAGVERIEEFTKVPTREVKYDKMLLRMYDALDQDIFTITKQPEPIVLIDDIAA